MSGSSGLAWLLWTGCSTRRSRPVRVRRPRRRCRRTRPVGPSPDRLLRGPENNIETDNYHEGLIVSNPDISPRTPPQTRDSIPSNPLSPRFVRRPYSKRHFGLKGQFGQPGRNGRTEGSSRRRSYSGSRPSLVTRMTASPSARLGASTSLTIRLSALDLRR